MKTTIQSVLLTSLFLSSWIPFTSCSKTNPADEENQSLVQAVRVESLKKSNLRKFIELNGNIRAEKSMSVYPVIQGKIASTPVHLGSSVKKGDVIVYVDPSVPGSQYVLNAVTAPISGTVISIPLKEGTRVNTETAVAAIGDLSKLQVITYIPERYVSFLSKGQDADLVLEAYPDEIFSATVAEVSPVLDEGTRTKEVILNFASPDNRINAGMFANVKLYLKNYDDVFSIPTACIIEKQGKKYVYVIDEAENPGAGDKEKARKVRFVEIKVGEEIENRTIIEFADEKSQLAALSENSSVKVVIQGYETLQDGSSVNIAE